MALISRNKLRKKRFFVVGIIALLVFSNEFILDEVFRWWETPGFNKTEIQKEYEFGVVLGGMLTYDKSNDVINFQQGIDRMLQALDLYKSGKIKKIFISGGSGSLIEECLEAKYLHDYFIRFGIPEEDLLYETESRNTDENARYTAEYFEKNNLSKEIILISSAYHLPRASKCFEKSGFIVKSYPANRFSGPRKFVFDHCFIPNAGVLARWNSITHEWIGYISYWIMGYM